MRSRSICPKNFDKHLAAAAAWNGPASDRALKMPVLRMFTYFVVTMTTVPVSIYSWVGVLVNNLSFVISNGISGRVTSSTTRHPV